MRWLTIGLLKNRLAVRRMPFAGEWCKVWIYFGFVFAWAKGARPRFDTSADMGLVLVPADAEVDSVIFRLRATDQDADFPLVFEVTGNSLLFTSNCFSENSERSSEKKRARRIE